MINLAAGFVSLFFIGITIGRALSGFLTLKFNDKQMVRLSQLVMGIGMIILILPFDAKISLVELITIGLGCAPICPNIIYSTPEYFGLIAENLSLSLLPLYLFAILLVMFYMHENLNKKTLTRNNPGSEGAPPDPLSLRSQVGVVGVG